MASYSTKLKMGKNRKAKIKFQLNVNNALEKDYRLEPLRYTPEGEIRKYQIISPRTWKFTTTINF